jgi:glycine cleavage system transcriptional repressor
MARYWLSALGADRPGIVKAVTGVLVDHGCNLLDSSMTVLQGQFAILLVVDAPRTVHAASLEAALRASTRRFDLVVSVRPVRRAVEVGPEGEGEPWSIAVHGADRPGIVHAVASALVAGGGNIVDLRTHLVEGEEPLYVMTLRATLPRGAAGEAAARRVQDAARDVGAHCTVRRDEADVL